MEERHIDIPEEVIQASEDLFRLNLSLHHPEVAEWLHSEEAEKILKALLANAPGHGSIH